MPPMNDSKSPTSWKSALAWVAAIAAFAIALRLTFLLGAGDSAWPHSTYFEGDAPLFAQWADALDRGRPFEAGLPLHSPVVPHLMHWLAPAATQAPPATSNAASPAAAPQPQRDF